MMYDLMAELVDKIMATGDGALHLTRTTPTITDVDVAPAPDKKLKKKASLKEPPKKALSKKELLKKAACDTTAANGDDHHEQVCHYGSFARIAHTLQKKGKKRARSPSSDVEVTATTGISDSSDAEASSLV